MAAQDYAFAAVTGHQVAMNYSITAKSTWHTQDFDITLLKFDGCI